MADILIRDIPDDIVDALKVKAAEDGKSREAWLKEQILLLAAKPIIKKRYSFKAYGENGAYITIERRYADGPVQRGAKNCSQEQFDAFKKAALLAERNELGDYEAAYKLLLSNFDEVFAS